MEPHILNKSSRIDFVDTLRGFAVIAIGLIHSVEHFIYSVYPNPSDQPEWLNIMDNAALSIIFSLIAGKGYAIFSILFGFTFAVQYANQRNKNKDFGLRFLWRLILLAGFATLNSMFFPGGDVLLLYSIVGIILIIIRKWSDRAVLIFATILLLQPMQWFYYISYLIDPAFTLPEQINGTLYSIVNQAAKTGKLLPFIWENITTGQIASLFWAIEGGRFLQTGGLFMLGLLIARRGLFISTPQNIAFWTKTLIICAILFAPVYQLRIELYNEMENPVIKQTIGVMFDMWQKLLFTFVLVGSFIVLYQKQKIQHKTKWLRTYGKMSLTNYVSQSFIGAWIFFPIGLNLAPYTGYFTSLLIGIGIVSLQMLFCKWWLNWHRQGPLEGLWKKLTWLGKE